MGRYVIVLGVCLVASHPVAAQNPSVTDLLDKYRATQDRLKRFIAKGETTRESTIQAGGELSVMNWTGKIKKRVSEIRYDGDRISLRSYSWGDIANKNVPEANAHYRSILWDGKTYIQYTTAKTKESGVAFVKKHDRSKKTEIALGYGGAPLMGICFVDDEPVDVILRQPETISVRDETEQIGGSPCYVIDAVTRHGKYTVWIDPQHGYNIARVELRRGPGDLRRQELLKNMTTSFSLRNVRFEKVGDVWIPMEADYQKTETRERTQTFDGMFTESKWHHKRTEIVLNPDFEAMSAFIPDDIKDGTKVYVVGVPAIRFKWLNGELVPNVDEAVIDEIDKMADEILADVTSKVKPELAPSAITVTELLAKYAETQDKLQSFIIKAEDSPETTSSFSSSFFQSKEKKKTYYSSELRFDGNRISYRRYLWGDFGLGSDLVHKDKPQYRSSLWDGNNYFGYSKSPTPTARPHGIVKIDHSRKYAEKLIQRGYSGARLLGFFDDERVDSILQQADTISVRDKMQMAGKAGSQCYVIDAVTKYGKYTVWIDPEHGYNIAKAQVQRKAGDMWGGQRLEGKASFYCSISNVVFEKIDNVWVPMEADVKGRRIYRDGNFHEAVNHHKRIEVILNPNHDALGSFVPDDIENGAEVLDLAVEGIMYIWQDGELIPNIDEAVPGSIRSWRLLKKYAETQDKLRSFIAKGESTIEYIKIPRQSGRMQKELCEFRTDGDRVNHRGSVWDKLLSKDKALYKSFLWDGKSFIQYRQGPQLTDSTVFIEKNDDSKKRMIATEYKGAPLMGICGGDYDRIDSILRKADNISLRQKTEQVGNSQCYVIDAVTKRGKYRIWIDPEHGYNIAKIELQKRKGDLIGSSERVEIGMLFLLINVRFEKTDEVWVPVEADMKQYQDDQNRIIKWHHKRTKMTLNPDHNALGSFVPDDIPEGTKEKLLTVTY